MHKKNNRYESNNAKYQNKKEIRRHEQSHNRNA